MKDKKTFNHIFNFVMITLFITYITLYFANSNGYYEARKKITLTNEQIKKFEQDIKDGKDVSTNEYLQINNKKYDNKTSELGYKTSKVISEYMQKGVKNFFDFINKAVDD